MGFRPESSFLHHVEHQAAAPVQAQEEEYTQTSSEKKKKCVLKKKNKTERKMCESYKIFERDQYSPSVRGQKLKLPGKLEASSLLGWRGGGVK